MRVDGINNVTVQVAHAAFESAGVRPHEYPGPVTSAGGDGYRVKVGAGGTRYVGDVCGLGQDPRRWPETLPASAASLIIAAIPHARTRIEIMRKAGKRVPNAVYSNDLARVRSESPDAIRQRYRASAASTREYEAIVRSIKAKGKPEDETADLVADALVALVGGDAVIPPVKRSLLRAVAPPGRASRARHGGVRSMF